MPKKKTLRPVLASVTVALPPNAAANEPRATKKAVKKKAVKRKAVKKRAVRNVTRKSGTEKLTSRRALANIERRAAAGLEKNRRLAKKILAELVRRKDRVSDDFHAIGVALRRLSDKALYGALGYATFDALLVGEKLFGRTVAYQLMAVAEAYPAKKARELGVAKAYHLIAYTEATPAPDLARTLAAENARIGKKRLTNITVRELRDATRVVRSSTGTGRAASGPEKNARKIAREVQKELRAKGARSAEASAKRVGGEWRIQITIGVGEAGVVVSDG